MEKFMTPNLTKHEQILNYIEALGIGSKISVRQIAKDLDVSEGTAYRAMKEARELGLLMSRERIGTLRVERPPRNTMQQLNFFDVASIVDGRVLGGTDGLHKTLNKFVIGAMKQEEMLKYVDAGSLLIVGNRDEAHLYALRQGAGILITGGFDATEEVKRLADHLGLPLISSKYDTFTVASMINRAMYDRMIKQKMMLVGDMASVQSNVVFLKANYTVREWNELQEKADSSGYPVVDEWNRVIGIITAKDVEGASLEQTLDKLMTRNPLTVTLHTSVTAVAHMMALEGIELLPVVDSNQKLIGLVRRDQVLDAMQYIQNQPQIGDTFEDMIWSEFRQVQGEHNELRFRGIITPQMTNRIGTVSEGVLTILMTQAAYHILKERKRHNILLDNISMYYLRPVQLESEVDIVPRMIDISRKLGKIEVEIYVQDALVCKSLLTAQVIHPT